MKTTSQILDLNDPVLLTVLGIKPLPKNINDLSSGEVCQLYLNTLIMGAILENQREIIFQILASKVKSYDANH